MRALGSMTWIFGYGSLVFRPAFTFVESRPAYLTGYERRFWQGSTDHRGVPEAPGRVVTLITSASSELRCVGVAYRVDDRDREKVLAYLDVREQGGYERLVVPLFGLDGERFTSEGLVYVATERNANYLGEASLEAIGAQIASARGPSGHNLEYVSLLAQALRELGADDEHVFAIERVASRMSGRGAD